MEQEDRIYDRELKVRRRCDTTLGTKDSSDQGDSLTKLPSGESRDREEVADPLSSFAREREVTEKTVVEKKIKSECEEDPLKPKLFRSGQTDSSELQRSCKKKVDGKESPKETLKLKGSSKQRIFKVIILGDTNVGKTCLALRFCAGIFPEQVEATIGVDFREKSIQIGGDTIKLQLWDTAGQERFRKSMVPHYYHNASAVVFVYDVTKPSSFQNLPGWISECNEYNLNRDMPRILIGNKCDLNDQIAVTTIRAQQFADWHQMPLFETSAKAESEVDNVESIFLTLAYKLKCCRPWMQTPEPCISELGAPIVLAAKRQERDDGFCVCA